MEAKVPPTPASVQNPKLLTPTPVTKERDVFNRLENYLAKRDGIDKLLKIYLYSTRFILATSLLPKNLTLNRRLKNFESSVGVTRKALRLGQYFKSLNALRNTCFDSKVDLIISVIAYGGEGLAHFVEQFVWLIKSGLIDATHARQLQKISTWAEFVGYIGSILLKLRELKRINQELFSLQLSIEILISKGMTYDEEAKQIQKLKEKKSMTRVSIVQNLADMLVAQANIRNGKGRLTEPILLASAGLFSAVMSTRKNWRSC